MGDRAAQDFWLESLAEAGRFNRWVLSRFERHLGAEVLEVGCGSGNFTVLMAARGHNVTAIDVEPDYVARAKRRLAGYPNARVSVGEVGALVWRQRFDTVVALDVLEHVADDGAVLARLAAALKPDGKLVLKVPAARWLHTRMDDALGHRRRYDRASLAAKLRSSGFEPIESRHINMAGALGWWFNGKLLRRDSPPAEQVKLFNALVPVFRAAEAVLPLPLGLSLITVASKDERG
jgi:trans-aconitate methyltransferase